MRAPTSRGPPRRSWSPPATCARTIRKSSARCAGSSWNTRASPNHPDGPSCTVRRPQEQRLAALDRYAEQEQAKGTHPWKDSLTRPQPEVPAPPAAGNDQIRCGFTTELRLMSDNHTNTCEQNARRESFVAEPTTTTYPLVLRRGLKGSWIRAVLKMASPRMARRTMDLAVLLVVGMAASEARAQPRSAGRRRWVGHRWAGHRWAGH